VSSSQQPALSCATLVVCPFLGSCPSEHAAVSVSWLVSAADPGPRRLECAQCSQVRVSTAPNATATEIEIETPARTFRERSIPPSRARESHPHACLYSCARVTHRTLPLCACGELKY
jgi:hypothetical protein